MENENANNRRVVNISTLAYDLNAIIDFVFQNSTKSKVSEIKETYEQTAEGGLKLAHKTMSEVKNEEMDNASNIRYNLVLKLMDMADNIIMDEYDDVDFEESLGDEVTSASSPIMARLGDTFAINTLLREGMLVNMNLNELTDGKTE